MSKTLGMAALESLLQLETELAAVSSDIRGLSPDEILRLNPEYILELRTNGMDALAYTGEGGESIRIFGEIESTPVLDEDERAFLINGKSALLERADEDGPISLYICRAVDDLDSGTGVLIGKINPKNLLKEKLDNYKPIDSEYWILNSSGMVLLGSIDNHGSPSVAVAGAADHVRTGYMEFEIENEAYLAFCWDIFLKQQFHLDKWRIVLGERDKESFAPIANFRKTFLQVISLAILIVGFLSIMEIRRSLEPLDVLSESSRRIANGDFTHRANVTSNDEFEELADSFNLMTNRLAKQFEDLKSQANITQSVLAVLDRNRIIATILDEFPNIFRCDLINLILLEEMQPGLASIYTRERDEGELHSASTHLDNAEQEELHRNHVLLNKEINRDSPPYLSNMEEEGIAACSIFPIFMSRGLAGAVVLGYNHSIVFRDDEVIQIRQLTDYLAVALENAELVSKLEKLNIGTLRALARTIDAKSPWTAGHSERVTKVAVNIGREMNLTKKQLDDLRKGGLLHDIGKIAIPVNILDKPGKLSDKEFEIIKKHVNYGVNIIEPIYSYRDVLPIIQQHHERIDGSGYPYGLTGAEISLYARILAVADVYDAMTSDRPYRRAMEHSKTLELIRNDAGKKYDSTVVDAFIRSFGERVVAEKEPVGSSASVDN